MPRYNAYKILQKLDTKKDVFAVTLLDQTFKTKKLSRKNKALLNQIVYGVIRYQIRLDFSIDQIIQTHKLIKNKPYNSLPDALKIGLRIGAYQLLFLDKIPDYAAVNETVKLFKKIKYKQMANKILRCLAKQKNEISFPKEQVTFLSIFYAYPQWLIKRWLDQFGEEKTIQICNAGNSTPALTFRVNSLKTNLDKLTTQLTKENITIIDTDTVLGACQIKKTPSIDTLEAFKNGLFYIQDLTAINVASFVAPKPNEIILDLCAAPGGKTTHMAELMQNSGEIIALDVSETKIKKIKENIKRLGITNTTCHLYDGINLKQVLKNKKFDRILIDAPCSNTGVFSRRIEARLNLDEEKLTNLHHIQTTLLANATHYLKENGVIVYSTCSIDMTENRELIDIFLANNRQFKLDKEKLTLPIPEKQDGGYIARLTKN